ncbi:hypothetical protein CAEBREN_11016 [Caenorhabditis brenneri]|uniref:Uncharacterized protein n=1 Tax=Caenorhabditis brenneri TaxID=135651 RepID=G0P0D4_CAEBE|nr:hypothetical protein CAEBREN_11016 [Caenorhabditis brenneri]
MSSNKDYQKQETTVNSSETLLNKHHPIMATVNSSETLLNKQYPIMSINKDHQKPEAVHDSIETNHSHQLTQPTRLPEATLSEAHAKIQKLEVQLKETEEHLIKAQVNQKVSEALNFLYDAKLKNMQAQIDEFDNLTTQAQEFFGKIWREFETQSKNKLNESEALRIQGLEDLKACRSEFQCYKGQSEKQIEELEIARVKAHQVLIAQKTRCSDLESQMISLTVQAQRTHAESEELRIQALEDLKACRSEFQCYKTQTEKQIEELENTRVKAHQVLVAQRTRCSELESQMICLTARAQRAHAASQAIQQSLDRERAAFKDRLKKQLAFFKAQHVEFLAEWEATDKRVKQELIDELVQAVAALPIEPEVPKTLLLQAQAQPAETGSPKKRGQAPKMETQTAKKRRIE